MSNYDSREDTTKHIMRVRKLVRRFRHLLNVRSINHDDSKMSSPEKETFDRVTPKLKSLTYGSAEYRKTLAEMKTALEHHYANNRHHPEHFENGIDEMTLVDVVEMLCDWKAASERHDDGDIMKSIEINQERFNLSDQLANILKNTVLDMGLISEESINDA